MTDASIMSCLKVFPLQLLDLLLPSSLFSAILGLYYLRVTRLLSQSLLSPS